MVIECYAERLLNPFRGAVHTIRYASAEAVTLDGTHWDLYVANDQLLRGLSSRGHVQISDIRYGSWSADKGLKRGPLYPSEDFRRMEEMGAIVYEHLIRVHEQLPFPFRDHFELWLLDGDGGPLALLQSAREEKDCELDVSIEWRAGFAARECFTSAAAQALDGTGAPAADYLARYINSRAGTSPAAQWFRREPDGRGTGLGGIGLTPALAGRVLPAAAFPPFLLATSGHDPAHRQLIKDYHAWQAPWLLLLPELDAGTRRLLERQARGQALVVFKHYRLYPQILDDGAIKAALVEAVLRRGQMTAEHKDDPLSTFYLEMGPTSG